MLNDTNNWVNSHFSYIFRFKFTFIKILKISVIKNFKKVNFRSFLWKITIQTVFNVRYSFYLYLYLIF